MIKRLGQNGNHIIACISEKLNEYKYQLIFLRLAKKRVICPMKKFRWKKAIIKI